MKKFLLLILTFLSSVSLMAIGIKNGSTKDFIPDKSNVETSVCDEATVIFIDGYDCGEIYHNGWYKFDLTKLQDEEEIRILLTNPYGIGGGTYSVLFYDSYDVTDPLLVLSGEMVNELSSIDTVIPKQVLEGINELYFHTTFSEEENISMNISPYIPCSQFDLPYYEWGTQKLMDASLTEFENAFYFVDIEGFYATPQRFNVGDLSSNQSVKLTVNNPSISEGVFAFISLNNDCSSQGRFVGRPGSIFAHRIESGQTHSWILDFPYLFEGEQDAYFLPAITTGDGSFSFISGTWSLEIINAIKTSTCADAIDFQSDVLYEQLGNTNQYYTLNGALQDDITPLATEVTITNQSENEAEWICSVGYCGVEEIIAIEQLAAGETKTIQLEIPAFDTYYPEGGGNLYANITTTEDISMLFDVVDSDTTLPIEPCMNATPISLGETVTAPANEESWYVLDITEVHEKQQEFRWTFTNLSDLEAEVNLGMFLDCFTEDLVVDFGTRSFAANQIMSSAWSYSDLTDIFPDYISMIHIRIIPTEDISLQFAVVDSDTSESEPCLNVIPISLGETVTAPANEESWYVLDITEVHEKQQEFRWTFTNLSDLEAEMNMGMFFSCDSDEMMLEFNKSFPANRIMSLVWSYPDVTDFFPDDISSIFIRITPTEDMAIRFSLPATCEEEAIELDWCNVQLSQLSTGWYKWNVADIHSNQEDVVFNVTNDMMYPISVTMDYYVTCEDTKPMNDFGGSQTYALGNNQQIISYQRFVELFATGTDSFGEYYESGFHNNVYIHISSIEQDYEPEPTPETHLIHYTSTNGKIVTPYKTDGFGANIISNTYKDGQGVITFDGPVTNIGQEAFSGSNITSIVIPESVQTIGASAFHSCYELTSISLPENLTNIDFATFAYCSRLPKISIPRNVTSIGPSAFYGCYVLDSLTIPENVTSIGEKAFYSCSSLKTIIWNAYKYENTIEKSPLYDIANTLCTIIFGDSMTHIPNHMCYNLKLNKIILPIGLESIGDMAFSGSNITSIVIPESVQTIGASAFHSCYELTSISLPENLTNIDFATFAYCSKLPKITIPHNVTSIGPSAFYGCYVLDSLTIPENVTSIGEKAFYSCSSLKTIIWNAYKYENTIEKSPLYDIANTLRTIIFGDSMTHIPNHMCYNLKLNKIILPIGLESIGDMAFSGSNITSIVIPESVQTIGASAFHSCYELTSISLPENLTNIDFATFAYCSRLPKISIPHNVTSIGTSAFYGCPTLTTLYANPTTPPSLGSSAFENSSLDTVYVPCGSTNAYKSSSWNTYCTNFIEPEVLYSVNLHSADTIKGQVAFDQEPSCDNTAIIRAIPSSGYSFTTWNDGVTNNPRTLFLSQDTTFTANFELIILDAEYVTICYGESYTWDKNGQTYTEAGTYTSISSEGEATLYLTVLPEVTITNDSATICYGETYSWNGHTYTESGDYVYTTTAANGCDSIVTLHLTINQTQYAEESIVACDSYEWNGETYTESGEYTYTTTAANGCDSIVTLHLTVNKTQYAEETIVACDSYEWNGKTYTESGEYTYTTTAANGCDSIVTLHLTINKSEVGAIEYATICYDETYTWNGQTYAVSGEYSVTLTNAAGCDSLAVLSITVLPEAIVDEQSISISENELPYTWHNQEINGSGVYTYTIPYTQTECDSAIYILNVEVETDTLENKCGDDLYWIYDTGNLTITGTGDMYDYTPTSMPWQILSKEIRTILLPDEMSSIGAFAFTDCYYLPSINIPSSVVTINDGAFENCRLLSTISFANNGQLTTIGSWAFYNCHELKDVVIPEGVTEIGHAAFYGCTYLKDLTLPASLQSIADNGFAGCSKLAQIQVNAIIPPQVNARTFEEVDRSIPVIVPDESVEQYKSAPVWKEFNVRGKIGTGVENITSTTNNVQKILRDGQLLILHDDKTYTIMGQEL